MTVGLLVIATGRYRAFFDGLLRSAAKWFFQSEDVCIHVFTDAKFEDVPNTRIRVVQHLVPNYGYPKATLYRYKMFTEVAGELQEDMLFYCDVDMKYIGRVQPLPDPCGLLAVQHAGFSVGQGTYEERQESTAYVPPAIRKTYCAGGFLGGYREPFLSMAAELARRIDLDEENGVTAIWHDESHWNAYISVHDVHVLPYAYCYPEERKPYSRDVRLLCLYKDNLVWRQEK